MRSKILGLGYGVAIQHSSQNALGAVYIETPMRTTDKRRSCWTVDFRCPVYIFSRPNRSTRSTGKDI